MIEVEARSVRRVPRSRQVVGTDSPLVERGGVPCHGGIERVQESEVATLLDQLPGWQVEEAEDHRQLVKEFRTRDFVSAVEFVDRITPIAEAAAHHPNLFVSWGLVRVQLWTHDAGGLSEKDFALAGKIDSVAGVS